MTLIAVAVGIFLGKDVVMINKYCCLFILYLFVFSACADYKTIDRGQDTWSSTTGYFIVFVARDYVPGHAFVIWGVRDRSGKKWMQSIAYGLYPKTQSKEVVFGEVPGHLKREALESLKSVNSGLAVAVSEQIYNYTLTNTEAIRSGNYPYSISLQNCVHFTDLVARAISLNTPNLKGLEIHPQMYISKLMALNN